MDGDEAELAGQQDTAAASREAALAALQLGWGAVYTILVDSHGTWRARRLDGLGGWLTADGPGALGQQIGDDYATKPVAR